MDATRLRQLQDLFEAARPLGSEPREQLLRSHAVDDRDLADRVRTLLDADAATGVIDDLAPRFASLAVLLNDDRPERIGAYRPLREIGRGGMGIVYLAERADGELDQHVAVKLINSVSRDDRLHRRFFTERRILAGLDHPNIARLLDGGVTGDGRPYLVMEYVDGLPITDYADRHQLDVRERLRLFLDVCAAVQHAHQNLVIHRDLKPANILVTNHGRVQLLDFGIAKLIDRSVEADGEASTGVESRVMTPQYASPEQVRGEPLTTASDVYALGVVLYQLLCGAPPYRITTGSAAEVAALVCEHDPERPSARVSRIDHAAPSRGVSPELLPRLLRGDLDSIVMMALRKEPQRRYASADLLRQDLDRHLSGLPVLAHRGSRRYRARKFLQRHRIEVGAGAAVLAALLAALALTVYQRQQARLERDRAERALAESTNVTAFLVELFHVGDEGGLPDPDLSAIELVDRGARRAGELSAQPLVQARLLDVVGQMSLHLGRLRDAENRLERAVAIRRTATSGVATDLADSLIHLAWVHRMRREYERAVPLVDEALDIRRRHEPVNHAALGDALYERGRLAFSTEQERWYREALQHLDDTPSLAEPRIKVLQGLSTNFRRQGRLNDAVIADREALAIAERHLGPEHHATGYAMIHLADHVLDLERDEIAAEHLLRRGLELMTRHHGENSVRLTHGLNSLAGLLSRRGDGEAESLYRRALTIATTATGPEHVRVGEQLQLLAGELARQRRLAEAEGAARQALAVTTRAVGPRHPVVASKQLPLIARVLDLQGRHDEADRTYRRAFDEAPQSDVLAGEMHRDYGLMLLRRGDHPRAEQQLLRSLTRLERAYADGAHPNLDETRRSLTALYQRMNRPDAARRYRVAPGRFVAY